VDSQLTPLQRRVFSLLAGLGWAFTGGGALVRLVDTPCEILANKLTALLSRWAVRDLVDVRALLDAGGDLSRGLEDAARKDSGFSPPTLAWVLSTQPATGLDPELLRFRGWLIDQLAP
jgi:hypothetical protein